MFAALGSSLQKLDFQIMVLGSILWCVFMGSSAELDAEVKDKERELKKINYTSVSFLAFFFFYFSRSNFFAFICSFSIVVWGVLTQKKPFAGKFDVLWVVLEFFSFLPLISVLPAPPAPDFMHVLQIPRVLCGRHFQALKF